MLFIHGKSLAHSYYYYCCSFAVVIVYQKQPEKCLHAKICLLCLYKYTFMKKNKQKICSENMYLILCGEC